MRGACILAPNVRAPKHAPHMGAASLFISLSMRISLLYGSLHQHSFFLVFAFFFLAQAAQALLRCSHLRMQTKIHGTVQYIFMYFYPPPTALLPLLQCEGYGTVTVHYVLVPGKTSGVRVCVCVWTRKVLCQVHHDSDRSRLSACHSLIMFCDLIKLGPHGHYVICGFFFLQFHSISVFQNKGSKLGACVIGGG